jgi:hypothetical protein
VSRYNYSPNSGGLLSRLRALFSRTDPEAERRQWLMARGRIVEGLIIDLVQQGRSVIEREIEPDKPCSILYRYATSGVTYESSQVLSPQQLGKLNDYRVGVRVSVRYDPRRPANSFVE